MIKDSTKKPEVQPNDIKLDDEEVILNLNDTDDDEVVEEKAKKTRNKGGKKNIILYAVIGVVALLAICVVVKLIKKPKTSPVDVTQSILDEELGTFNYTFEVKTSPHDANAKKETAEKSYEDVANDTESMTDDTETATEEATEEKAPSNVTTDWTNSEGIKTSYWEYPNYKIQFTGCVESVEPIKADVKVNLTTDYYSEQLTELIVVDGKYYLDIESMRLWLMNSKDSYFVSIGQQLPEGSRWYEIPESEFYITSRYAEESEKDIAKTTSILDEYRYIKSDIKLLLAQLDGKGTINNDKEGASSIVVNADEGVMSSIFNNVIMLADSNYYQIRTENKYDTNQASRERDNVVSAFSDLMSYFLTNMGTDNSTDLTIQGQSKQFTNGNNQTQMEVSWAISYTLDNVDKTINASLVRSSDMTEIKAPTDSTLTKDNLTDSYLPFNCINQIADYLNFTKIKLSKQLEITPTSIKSNILEMFIQLVNDSGTYDEHLNEANITEYFEKYANLEITDDTPNKDKINAQLVSDFYDSINAVTGGVVKEVEKEETVEIPKYTTIADTVKFDDKDVNFTATFNEEESSNNLYVIDLDFLYQIEVEGEAEEDSDEVVDDSIKIDLTNFSLHTLLKSKYPANSDTIIRDYDAGFDFDKLKTEVKVQPNVKTSAKLYIVISSDDGYMDLWYGDINLGELINH